MNTTLLKEICETAGAPGFENRIRNIVIREIKDHVDDIQIDKLGNVIALKKGKKNKKVMIAAHMDEIGFMVTHVDDKGFVRFHCLGGFDPKTLTSQRVIIHGKKDVIGVMGSKPIHLMQPEERNKAPQLSDYYIDLGMNKKEVDKLIQPGDSITRERSFIEMGECFNCKSLDNRISVFILIETLKELKKPCFDTYAVFTVQEEVGLRGAYVSAHHIEPDFGFGLDTTIAFDTPGAQPHEKVTQLGKGAAIKIMDGGTICDQRMIAYMKSQAVKQKITHQMEVLPAGSTDTAGIQRMGKTGAIAGAVSIPTRHIHSVIEMVHKKDVANAIKLLNTCILNLDKHSWDF